MGTRLFVDGVPSLFTDQQFKELFIRYGTVLSAKVVRDPKGQSLRFGYVEMTASHEANMAIQQLNRSWLYGQVLVVKMDKKEVTGPTWGA